MNKDHAEYKKTIKDRGRAGKSNALSSAAPLESSDSFTPQPKLTTATETKTETKKPDFKALNQKAGLLKSLLAIGAIKPAIAIMSKYDWIAETHTEIADLVLRLASVSLSSLYDTVGAQKESSASFTRPKARYSAAGPIYPVAKPMLTLWAPTPPSTLTTDFVFFFPNWADRVPICTTLDDLQGVLEPLIGFIGVLISRDPAFMTKFLRLGRNHIAEKITINTGSKSDPENPTRQFWFRILRQYMLPAISLVQGNTVCTMEIWSVLRLFETSSRWMLYGEWQAKLASEKSHPELQVRFRQALKESRSILSRLAHDTLNGLTGSIAKLAHSTPTIFFSTAINQLMSYDNLATVFLQALRYCTIMDFDVLLFFIISTFGNTDRPRLKDDGVNTSNWVLREFLLFSASVTVVTDSLF
jgi:THO complex subunit 2